MIDISDRIPPSLVAVYEAIQSAAQKGGISFFVIGAAARDMLLRYAYQLPVRRATRDIDIAIRVEDWKTFDSLVSILISTGDFKPTIPGHRFRFKGAELIDIVPFGQIAGTRQSITWPPTGETVMGVLGFDEAFRSAIAVTVRREPQLDVPVSTLAGLAVMKLISWNEAYPKRGKDSEDFYYAAENYPDAGNDDRLYHEASDLRFVRSCSSGTSSSVAGLSIEVSWACTVVRWLQRCQNRVSAARHVCVELPRVGCRFPSA